MPSNFFFVIPILLVLLLGADLAFFFARWKEPMAERSLLFGRLFSRLPGWVRTPSNPDRVWLIAALAVYGLVVSLGIDRYPIYFFTDEAMHMNMASDFLQSNFQNYYHEFLPTFFSVSGWVNGTSVYVQVIPYLLFGKSVIATRLVSAAITLLGALALGLLLKQVFNIKYYWAGILALLTTPAWFLHARTAFEYAEVASFYCIFLYCYGRYRNGDLRFLYAAVVAGALTFYTHGLGEVLMGVTGLALLIVDFPYHIQRERRKTVLLGLVLGMLLFLPFVRYWLAHSGETAAQIQRRDSYWADGSLNLAQKVQQFFGQYLYGLNPAYWYFQNSVDIDRHVMKGYGDGLWMTLPFAVLGFVQAVRNIRWFPNRLVLIAFIAAPLPASIVAIGMPRMLWMAIPLAIFTTLGLSACLVWLEARGGSLATRLPLGAFALLTLLSLFMLGDALINGPTWSEDYGLYGMQYGAEQIFAETIVPDLEQNPEINYVVSPSWANGTEVFADFFVPRSLASHVSFGRPIDLVNAMSRITSNSRVIITSNDRETSVPITPRPVDIPTNTRFVATIDEYKKLLYDPKFEDIVVHKIIPYPNGRPGFYVLTLRPAGNIYAILAAERSKNRTPIEDFIQLGGQKVRVLHSPFGSGDLNAVFDHNPDTLARVLEANPFTFDLYPATPLDTHSLVIQTGSMADFTITVSLYAPGASTPVVYSARFRGLPPNPLVTMTFDKGPATSGRITIAIQDKLSGDTSQIHVRTIDLQ